MGDAPRVPAMRDRATAEPAPCGHARFRTGSDLVNDSFPVPWSEAANVPYRLEGLGRQACLVTALLMEQEYDRLGMEA